MSVGFGLLRAIIQSNTPLSVLVERGVDDDYFVDREQAAYSFILSYRREYDGYPSLSTVGIEIGQPNCFVDLPDEPIGFWVERVKERKRFSRLQSTRMEIGDLLERNRIEDALELMGHTYAEIKRTYDSTQILDLADLHLRVLEMHHDVQQGNRVLGVPFGVPYVDAISGGAQPGDSVVVAGETGVGKTYLALRMGLSMWEAGHSVLMLSTEMPELQLARRLLAMQAGLNSIDLKLGRSSAFAVDRARSIVEGMTNSENGAFFKILPGGLYSKVQDLLVVTQDFQPDALIVDGAYLLRMPSVKSSSRWEVSMAIMEALKNGAMTMNIPVISTYQFNRQNPGKLNGLMGTMAIEQLASIVFSFEFEKTEDRNSPNPIQNRFLKLLKGRDGEKGTVRMLYNMLRTVIRQESVVSGYEDFLDLGEEEERPYDPNPDASI